MKNPTFTFLKLSGIVLSACFVLNSCSHSADEKFMSEEMASAKAKADSVSVVSEATQQPKFNGDSNRTFVRKADLSFKVKDVRTATFDIERIVNSNRGYVTTSDLESTINYKNSVRISKDSMLDMINYTVQTNLIMRIPNSELDKTLSEIAALVDYLDYRRIHAEDITAQFQDATLTDKRYTEHKKRLEKAIDQTGKKLDQVTEAENDLLAKQESADNSKISTSELIYDVKYSTVSINIYQKETTRKEAYAYSAPVEPFQPSFGSKLLSAAGTGAVAMGEILLFFIKIWPVAVILIAFFFLFKKVRKLKWFN
ncbi:MAG: DUF4349 domain-containing protein [Bacteroidota bacterium]